MCTCTLASVHLSNTVEIVAKMLLGQFREPAKLNDVDIIESDFHMSAFRQRGTSRPGSNREAWETRHLILPPDFVPMWGTDGGCSGFIGTTRNATTWRVAKDGSLQLKKVKLQTESEHQAAHFPVYIHLYEIHTVE